MLGGSLYEKIQDVVSPILEDAGIELFELNVRQKRGDVFIQVLVDHPKGGINIDECTAINRRIARIFDEEDFSRDKYILEVSSPGMDRPLKTGRDFSRVTGKSVHVYLSVPLENRLEYTGVVKEADEQNLTLSLQEGEIIIPLESVNKGQQVI